MVRRDETVPSGPFSRWLTHRYEQIRAELGVTHTDANLRLAREIGWSGKERSMRTLFRYRMGFTSTRPVGGRSKDVPAAVFPRRVVEEALHHAGLFLWTLYPPERYPSLYDDVPIEPERFCPTCQTEVTPAYGYCLFCCWRFGPKPANRRDEQERLVAAGASIQLAAELTHTSRAMVLDTLYKRSKKRDRWKAAA